VQHLCDIRVELATIVNRPQNSKSEEVKAANKVKAARRNQLLEQLETHSCTDRAQSRRVVPTDHSRTLSASASAAAIPALLRDSPERKQALGEGAVGEEELEESSAPEPYEAERYMDWTVKKGSLPKASRTAAITSRRACWLLCPVPRRGRANGRTALLVGQGHSPASAPSPSSTMVTSF
jgi:hypothetical protein